MNNRMDAFVVVKLGGSYAASNSLRARLAALARWRAPVALVPGGGPFADTVRQAQARTRFSDLAAHHMALLAMEQFGLALCGLDNRFVPARQPDDFRRVLAAGRIPVWLPSEMALADPALEVSWRVTSDSLAVWLAGRLSAREVILLKQVPPPARYDVAALARTGIVDEGLPDMLRHSPVSLRILGPGWHEDAAA